MNAIPVDQEKISQSLSLSHVEMDLRLLLYRPAEFKEEPINTKPLGSFGSTQYLP